MHEPRTIIKICGITRVEDGLTALAAGADWLGFIRWPGSARYRPVDECAEVLNEIRAGAKPFHAVGVYVDAALDIIDRELTDIGFDRVQLHGNESMNVVQHFQPFATPVMKVIKIRDAASIANADDYPDVDLLADTDDALLPGGTGRSYDFDLLRDLVTRRRVLIAGGLKPENVAGVVERLRPYGVDVSSGVEISPGVKDHAKVKSFIANVRAK